MSSFKEWNNKILNPLNWAKVFFNNKGLPDNRRGSNSTTFYKASVVHTHPTR